MKRMPQGYRYLEHTSDALVEAWGKSLGEAFQNAGLALEGLLVDTENVRRERDDKINLCSKDLEGLLYQWLESLIMKEETEGMIYSSFDCRVTQRQSGYELRALARGEKFDRTRHEERTAVKAPTFHEMIIKEENGRVTLHFLLDL